MAIFSGALNSYVSFKNRGGHGELVLMNLIVTSVVDERMVVSPLSVARILNRGNIGSLSKHTA